MKATPHMRKAFQGILKELSFRRAWDLFSMVEKVPGKRPAISHKWRKRMIKELKGLVEETYPSYLRKWVKQNTQRREVRFKSRIPRNDKAVEVKKRLERKWGNHSHLVYVSFKGRKKCLKVGRSDGGLGRVANQHTSFFFRDASRVVVYFPKWTKKKILPALECALTHLYRPYHLDKWPAQTKYLDKCRVCRDADFVEKTVRKLFPA
jgi:hypothetical protein